MTEEAPNAHGEHLVHVLLIEDSPADADLIAAYLEEAPDETFRLTHVTRLADGVEQLESAIGNGERIDVVLLDFNLPDSAGLPTFDTASAAADGVPILVLTNLVDRRSALAAVRSGAQDYLLKREVDSRLLSRAIRYAIERDRSERALRESEERYALIALGANDGIWDWDLVRNRIYYSPRWKSLLGFTDGEIGDTPEAWLDRVHPDDLREVKRGLAAHLDGRTAHFESEHRIQRADGGYLWIQSRGVAVRGLDGKPTRIAGSINDIADRKSVEAQLLHDALHDALTDLPNRVLFLDRLNLSLVRTHRSGESHFAALVLDLDRFKNVNDSLGHSMGDRLLVEIGQRLTAAIRPGDTVARLGGDEFALVLEGVESAADAAVVSRRIQGVLARPAALAGQDVVISASIGIALSSTGYLHPEEMLRDADIAMYRAKAGGRERYEVFDQAMHRHAVALLKMETDLRRAVDQGDFVIHYQPIVSFETGRLTGFEALVRWRHPERGLVPPAKFIAVAEETGLIVPLGWWVLLEACGQLADWNRRFTEDEPLTVSCNVSGKLVTRPDVVERMVEILDASKLDPVLLRLEITENILMDHGDDVVDRLAELRALGLQLHIDDFGTGYSSLSYLQRFHYDTLKIDRSFVNAIDRDGDGSAIVRTIVALGNQLSMNVIAEGVETAAQARWLRELHCPQGQGYWFARPMEAGHAEILLEQHPVWMDAIH